MTRTVYIVIGWKGLYSVFVISGIRYKTIRYIRISLYITPNDPFETFFDSNSKFNSKQGQHQIIFCQCDNRDFSLGK